MYDDAYYRNINRLEALTMRYWPELSSILSLQSGLLRKICGWTLGVKLANHLELQVIYVNTSIFFVDLNIK